MRWQSFAHSGDELAAHGGARSGRWRSRAAWTRCSSRPHWEIEADIAPCVVAGIVKEPVAVRYAFTNAPDGNLFGDNGLPVPPFRSDDWPMPRLGPAANLSCWPA